MLMWAAFYAKCAHWGCVRVLLRRETSGMASRWHGPSVHMQKARILTQSMPFFPIGNHAKWTKSTITIKSAFCVRFPFAVLWVSWCVYFVTYRVFNGCMFNDFKARVNIHDYTSCIISVHSQLLEQVTWYNSGEPRLMLSWSPFHKAGKRAEGGKIIAESQVASVGKEDSKARRARALGCFAPRMS